MVDIKKATKQIFNRVYKTGEEIKNDLPNWVQRVIDEEAWKQAVDVNGEPFESVGHWLVANYPYGPGCGKGEFAVKYDELIMFCENRKELKDTLIRYRPKGKRGGDRGNQHTGGKVSNTHYAKKANTGSRLYIEERLQRDHPAIWKDYLAGKYASARQAGIAAGFIADSHDPLKRAKSNWNKMTKKQRKEFLEWIQGATP